MPEEVWKFDPASVVESSSVGAKQRLLTYLLGHLIARIYATGRMASVREVQRSKAQAETNAAAGIGIKNSLHLESLAADVMLYSAEGEYLNRSEDYKDLGEYWEGLHPICRWGGRFERPDGNHFSVAHAGRR